MSKPMIIQDELMQDIITTLCQDDGLIALQARYDDKTLAKYLGYAHANEFVCADFTHLPDDSYMFDGCEVLPKGYAFIQADDGIYEKTSTITIRLDERTLRAILIANISDSDMDKQDKDTLIAHIKQLPKEALTTLSNRLVEEALNTMPTLAHFLFRLVTGVES